MSESVVVTSSSSKGVLIAENLIGQVKWFNTKTGYGFITVCGGEYAQKDIFVHFSSIKIADPQYLYLVQGEYVNFDLNKIESDKYQYHAVNVHGINGGSIMCELRRAQPEVVRPRGPPRVSTRTPSTYDETSPLPRERKPDRRPERGAVSSRRRVSDTDEDGFERVVRKRPARGKPVVPAAASSESA
jgi:cold shock CspA family protein